MFLFISHLTVPADDRAALERHFRERSGLVDGIPGFLYLQLLRPQSGEASHAFLTAWETRDAFRAYMRSREHAASHAREPGEIMARTDVRQEGRTDEDAEHGSHGLAQYDVLVVDDDGDSRRVAARFLGDAGLRVREAPDGESALSAMRVRPPDVVVLNLMMPVLDGFGVLAAIRADPVLTGLPVIVLTAKSLTDAERQFLSRTAVRVLQKGEHRLADVAALVLRAAEQAGRESV